MLTSNVTIGRLLQLLLGSVSAGAYSVMQQIGFWVTIMCESISIAIQSLLSQHLGDPSDTGRSLAYYTIQRGIKAGLFLAMLVTTFIGIFKSKILSLLARSLEIQQAAVASIMPFLVMQGT